MSEQRQSLYEFGPYRLDTTERRLLRDHEPVPLTPKAFETLLVLVERSGHLVMKEELMNALWPDSFVEEANLTHQIWTLRKTLGTSGNGQSYIETVPRLGYRFVGAGEPSGADETLVVERHTLTSIITEEEGQTSDRDEPAPTRAKLLPSGGWKRHLSRKWMMAAAVLLLLVVGALVAVYRPWASRSTRKLEIGAAGQPALRSIAVLPFKAIGGAGDNDEYLSLGLADALITRLGRVREVVVRPTSAVRNYTEVGQDSVEIGRQQGVDAVLVGSYQRAGDRLRLTVQLVRVSDGMTLWSDKFDEKFTDIFSVQDSISERVACDLVTRICGEGAARSIRQKQINVEAYEAYLRGRYFWNKRTKDGYRKAIQYFNRAIEIDPAYAQAYVGLADATYFLGGDSFKGQREALVRGTALLRKAIEIDETLAEPHATLGLLIQNTDWNLSEAQKEFRRAIELNPNYATAHHWYGESLAFMGRYDEGLAEIRRAQELDPLSLAISSDVAKVHYLGRQYDLAIEQAKKTLEIDSNYTMALVWLAFAYSARGQHEEAVEAFHRIQGLEEDPAWMSYLGYIYGKAGRREEAREMLKRLSEVSKRTYVAPDHIMLIHLGLGNRDETFDWLERSIEERNVSMVALKVSSVFDELRPDPRFEAILRRAGFIS